MLPRFSKVKQRVGEVDTVLLKMIWGTLELGLTIAKKPLISDFDDALYPHQRTRNIVAITVMVLVHLVVGYFLLFDKTKHPINQGEERGQLIFLNALAEKHGDKTPRPAKAQPEKKRRQPPKPTTVAATHPKPVVNSPTTTSPVAAPVDTMSQIAAARTRRQALEFEENKTEQVASTGASENDAAMARIKANIQAANYNRKGTNGIFQVLDKGVQTGRFSFRGWTNDPHESTRQTFEVDAGVGGDVELALIRRMIVIIREHYNGDFNWESQRLGRVVVLSARPSDTASLERFMMKEFFNA